MTDKNELSSYEKKLIYNNAYNREKYRSFSVRYNIVTEASIIDWLQDKESTKEYLTELILKDMEKKKKKEEKKKEDKKSKKKNKKKKEK